MRRFLVLLIAGMTTASVLAQGPYRTVRIRDIQFVPYDSLRIADSLQNSITSRWTLQTSPFYKSVTAQRETVEVVAQCIVPPRIINYTAGGFTMILRDTGATGGEWSYMFARAGSTDTTALKNAGFLNVERGDIIRLRGWVDEFPLTSMNSITQFVPVAGMQINILDSKPVPAHTRKSVSQFYEGLFPGGRVRYTTGEPLEASLVEFTGLTVTGTWSPGAGRTNLNLVDDEGNMILMYDASGYFTTLATRQLAPYSSPSVGARIDTIRGVAFVVSSSQNNAGYLIAPMFPGDMVVGITRPYLATHRREPVVASPNDTIKISVRSAQASGGLAIRSVHFKYSVNNGPWVVDSLQGARSDSLYEWKLNPMAANTFVRYFFQSYDVNGNVTTLASSAIGGVANDTSRGFFFFTVLDRPLTVYDVQYTPFTNGRTAYLGAVASVSGVVTVDTSEMFQAPLTTGGTNAWYMQTSNQPWNGIWITGPDSIMSSLRKGDSVTVTGTIQENFDVTRIGNITSVVKHASNRPVPSPAVLTTGTFGPSVGNGAPSAEQWEGMLVRFNNVVVSNINPTFADPTEYEIDDGSGPVIVRRDGRHRYSNIETDTALGKVPIRRYYGFSYVQGIIYYSFNRYKIAPRGDADFGVLTSVFASDRPFVAGAFTLEQNYPNPFNPSTTIDYNIPVAGHVKVEVYNVLGQLVGTLVNEYHNPGRYQVRFDASRLPSGVYFYRLSAENISQVKRMVFLK